MIYITGDCHADWTKFSSNAFPEQKEMTRNDFVIVCGDFGIWHDTPQERYWLNWLEKKNFTLCFVCGNHENFDRLYGKEFPVVDFYGGKAHKIRENVFHLMRGYIFNLCGKKIFAFGGARSHDIKDGILEPMDYRDKRALYHDYNTRTLRGEELRINHYSWWEQEIPSKEEMSFGLKNLAKCDNKVDFIVTHCAPSNIALEMSGGEYKPDTLTDYFKTISGAVDFKKWFFGHYHDDKAINDKFILLYNQIIRIA